ncbi:MAG: hypothetical protein Tsb009_29400 [Planctomycetaceae bacterium]
MEGWMPLDVLFRVLHVGIAIVVLGGSIFLRFVLMPAADQLPDDDHTALRERIMGRWRKIVGIGIGVLLISGLYNYIIVMVPKHKGHGLYHALLGTKMILAFIVFFLASALTGRAAAFEGIRKNSKKWLLVTILLGLVVVLISGYVKIAPIPPVAEG